MTDRPTKFRDWEIRALLDGRKTQTRLVMPDQSLFRTSPDCHMVWDELLAWQPVAWAISSRGSSGAKVFPKPATANRLWVKEAHAILPRTAYRASIGTGTIDQREHPTDGYSAAVFREGFDRSGKPRWRPSIHMPRWASRLTLVVTDVRVQRVQEISNEDAVAEGCSGFYAPAHPDQGVTDGQEPWQAYRDLWDSLNAKRGYGWDEDPWVAALTFTVHHCNIDAMEAAA